MFILIHYRINNYTDFQVKKTRLLSIRKKRDKTEQIGIKDIIPFMITNYRYAEHNRRDGMHFAFIYCVSDSMHEYGKEVIKTVLVT
jgi:hypothetical protein